MVLNPRPIHLKSGRDVNTHLDTWASERIASAQDWAEVLAATRDWLDYSPRNELLLASYGAHGPVAGIETWRLVPTLDGNGCVVRGGEHGLPVRVPITTSAIEPDPHLGGARPTQGAVQGWEWRSVFCLEQLARRPDPAQIKRSSPPGDLGDRFGEVAEKAVRRTLRGRLPAAADPIEMLTHAAVRQLRPGTNAVPAHELAHQVAWLTADRVGQTSGPMPTVDPAGLNARERWEGLIDVLDGSRRLTAAIGKDLGVNLLASPLPRMEIDDDRVVATERRNRLPRASLAQLPAGRWVEVGPYTSDEWAARGETAAGKGAYLRINTTAYLVAFEHGDRSFWRLEDTRALLGAGRLAGADEPTLDHAKTAALATAHARYPQLENRPIEINAPIPSGTTAGWEPLPDRPGSHRLLLDHGVAAYVIASRDRWLPMIERQPRRLLETAGLPMDNEADARAAATQAGRAAQDDEGGRSRVSFDAMIDELATSPAFTHAKLAERVGTRLDEGDRAEIADNPDPVRLVELLGAAGVTPATTIAVLRAEDIEPGVVATVLPIAGVPPADVIRALHEHWSIDRADAAEAIGATATEMRAAGCTAAEILAARPTDLLSTLPADPHLWELSGGTLAVAGHSPHDITGYLASHAPDPDCYAAGLAAAIDDPTTALGLTLRRGMPSEALVATSERYGLNPSDTATALADSGATPNTTVQALLARCDGDPILTTQIARSVLQLRTDTILGVLASHSPELAEVIDLTDARPLSRDRGALLAAHRSPSPARSVPGDNESAQLLALLPDAEGPQAGDSRDDLLGSLPAPDPTSRQLDLAGALPEPDTNLGRTLTEIEP